jgi:integrase/recombinase XerD
MARPAGRPIGTRQATIADLRDEFLDRCRAKNLSTRTIGWYEDRTRRFSRWCFDNGILLAQDLTTEDLEAFIRWLQADTYKPQTIRGFAQVAKTLSLFGHRKGFLPRDVTRDFEMPRVPTTVIETFSEEQLEALLRAPDARRWKGIRDRALLLTLLDTMARVSELSGLNAAHVDLGGRSIRVMGKGRKERDLPLGRTATRALQRYRNAVDGLRPDDPFFISYRGRRLGRSDISGMVATYGHEAGIAGVRCSPHTLRHTGAKRFILTGGDVFTLQKLLGHASLVMARRYVELASLDVAVQHERFIADSLLRRPTPIRL